MSKPISSHSKIQRLLNPAVCHVLTISVFYVWLSRSGGGYSYSPMGYPGGGVNVLFNVSDLFWYFVSASSLFLEAIALWDATLEEESTRPSMCWAPSD